MLNLGRLSDAIHRRFIWLLVASYVLAAIIPAPGLWIRRLSFGEAEFGRETAALSAPALMLAMLLFNAGFGTGGISFRQLRMRMVSVGSGLLGNIIAPMAFVLATSCLLRWWHNGDETQNVLVGLGLVAAMPIAGSSTAWAQNADADLTLSLGLVVLSTLASPFTTPLILHSISFAARGEYSRELLNLADYGTPLFLVFFVLLPSMTGIAARRAIPSAAVKFASRQIKLVNLIVLLLLNYSNAAVSLPRVVTDPDPDFMTMVLAVVTFLCAIAFAAGWVVGILLQANRAQRVALMFGLGMNNNGTGLVIASLSMATHPRVLLPIILYNLVQHLMAASVDAYFYRPARSELAVS